MAVEGDELEMVGHGVQTHLATAVIFSKHQPASTANVLGTAKLVS